MKSLNGYDRRWISIGVAVVIFLSGVNAQGKSFRDDFNRPYGEVGNGWVTQTYGAVEINVVNNEVLVAGQHHGDWWSQSGISRPVEDETRFAFDFKADDNFNVHIKLYDMETHGVIEFYAWPGGLFLYGSRVSDVWAGWTPIPGSQMRTGEYNNLVVEQDGADFTLTLNGKIISNFTNGYINRIAEVFIGSEATPGSTGSLHIDNVIIGQAPTTDLNDDGIVDSKDMWIMYNHMDEAYPLCDIAPPPCGDGIVDGQDLAFLARYIFTDLVAHWRLDEETGDIALDCVGGNGGACHGRPGWECSIGKVGGALALDGTNDYISTPFILDPAKSAFSAFAWIYGGRPGQVILSQADGNRSGSTWLGINTSDGKLITGLSDMYFDTLVSDTVITDMQWHHVGLVYDWNTLHRRLYLDGTLIAEDDTVIGPLPSDGGLYIGAGNDLCTNSFFSGMIDDIRIYNVALSNEQVEALAK